VIDDDVPASSEIDVPDLEPEVDAPDVPASSELDYTVEPDKASTDGPSSHETSGQFPADEIAGTTATPRAASRETKTAPTRAAD
jgi:hypothetical protein